jgi:hypothetical protein
MENRKDKAGLVLGDLEVIEPTGERDKNGSALWLCHCRRCGKDCVKSAKHLSPDDPLHPKSCGCLRESKRADLSGQTFGGLEVIRRYGVFPNGSAAYLCKCIYCGREIRISTGNLKKPYKSCGCKKAAGNNSEKGKLGVEKSCVDGVHIGNALRKPPNKGNHTGVRGVWKITQTGLYRAGCQVHGEIWTQNGFSTIERAKEARDKAHAELLEKYNVEGPENGED